MRSVLACIFGIVALTMWTGTAAQEHEPGEHHHKEAAALKNPVKATPESIAAGKKTFDAQCVGCHGTAGKGDGKMAAAITTGPKPSDLTDATWKHGDSDGEIYTLIHDGSKGTA